MECDYVLLLLNRKRTNPKWAWRPMVQHSMVMLFCNHSALCEGMQNLASPVWLLLLAKPVTGDQLAQARTADLYTELGVTNTKLLACMRDWAAVNGKAMHSLGILYPNVMDIGCSSHTLDLVGDNVGKFMKCWLKRFARLIWWEKTDKYWSIILQPGGGVNGSVKYRSCFLGDVPGFLESVDAAPKRCQKLKCLLQSGLTNLLIEPNKIDAGKAFSDGTFALTCYNLLSTVKASIQVQHWPNTHTVACQLAVQHKQPALEQQLVTYA